MGNGNGNSDALYGLVDDVADLKAMIARWDARVAEDNARYEAARTKHDAEMAYFRKFTSQMMVVLQASCDKLVGHGQRFECDEGNLEKLEARLRALEVVVATWKK